MFILPNFSLHIHIFFQISLLPIYFWFIFVRFFLSYIVWHQFIIICACLFCRQYFHLVYIILFFSYWIQYPFLILFYHSFSFSLQNHLVHFTSFFRLNRWSVQPFVFFLNNVNARFHFMFFLYLFFIYCVAFWYLFTFFLFSFSSSIYPIYNSYKFTSYHPFYSYSSFCFAIEHM